MNTLAHTPVQKAHAKLRAMSAVEEERYWAEARDRALDIATIAICTGLGEDEVRHLAAAQTH
ncbi:MAG: hypothetical protein K9L88_10965 [Chromatiaceae bacterium]|nr:hypothetical protein [Chromatiaceae bacterium]